MTSIETIKSVAGVKSINLHEPTGRYYINLAGNGRCRGDQTSKLYVDAAGTPVVEAGRGITSSEYTSQRDAVLTALGYQYTYQNGRGWVVVAL